MGTFGQTGSADRWAFKTAKTILGDEKPLLIFPEGTRTRSGELGEAEAGFRCCALQQSAGCAGYISERKRRFRRAGKGFDW
jgi:1-acyl-sn-glycerol-3-phosphate acyltransferase